MRDTSDMMEDALSEDTMMDCEGDGTELEDPIGIPDPLPTIQDAAERLLNLLEMDDDLRDNIDYILDYDLEGDRYDDFLSSEDEGVELDETDEDDDDPENRRRLHQLASSLIQELKYPHRRYPPTSVLQEYVSYQPKDLVNMDDGLDTIRSHNSRNENPKFFERSKFACDSYEGPLTLKTPDDARLRVDGTTSVKTLSQQEASPNSWTSGWDACAIEALRYLTEEEGLPPHHPTVLAMKSHLELQRERTFARYSA
ncbi:uncharacterized protein [Prorops nasuta]|uniref:uncharacterized protein n=1 Tax=Prorops nasuta TaxID=863751 RepID=UPI0034CD6298